MLISSFWLLGISDKTVYFICFSIVFSIENCCMGVLKRNVLGPSLQHVLIFGTLTPGIYRITHVSDTLIITRDHEIKSARERGEKVILDVNRLPKEGSLQV